MQFKHPEILWALVLLIIPVLIHLFQLRRFKKTPFTNVAMLQKVVAESRKSNTLKKWLLLFTRLALLASLIIAFAQPFSSAATALQEQETVVYLDNSFSMQARDNGLSLLEKSAQELIKSIDAESSFSLFTNDKTYQDVTIKDIQNNLLALPYSHKQLNFDEIQLKAASIFSNAENINQNLILISDFQERIAPSDYKKDSITNTYFVPVRSKTIENVAIDSVYLQVEPTEQSKLSVFLSGDPSEESLPISLFNGETLIAKTSVAFKENRSSEVVFSIPSNQEINGRLHIVDKGLGYDNSFFFNINEKEKIKVLAVSDSDSDYLKRLFTQDEFVFNNYALAQLDYSALDNKNVVVLNNLKSIPNSLQKVLQTFKQNGGTIIVVPSMQSDLTSYNQFLSGFFASSFEEKNSVDKKVTTIAFQHPIYRNVFEKEVSNFQYPTVNEYFKIKSRAPKLLSLEGNTPFLCGIDGFYFFTASLETGNSNFKSSPLIVPTFYNMAAFSLKMSDSYHLLGKSIAIDIPITIDNNGILNVYREGYEFIPLQQNFPNKVKLTFDENPVTDGIYSVRNADKPLANISFNFPRDESKLNYLDIENSTVTIQDSISSLFEHLEEEHSITAYWKWFVILALFLILVEVIIQKLVT
ncbi:BatA domain-containing protein [Flagellimonas pacifica]|uniref:N-terminal double-transmembrane domain-containing protein n=1 Tax=Flagellimonas pacifica TaxID=1247520 RepID=A0A285MRI7_9FLAO|nr:BatA domain-containing protein [Allomuricauda parva]SNY99799.1 N-terminal double-transmembrane domain-containing protein [Allomuricauda parva]